MALNTYASLQTSIASWIKRSGDADLTDVIPDLITLAEERIARDLADSPALRVTQTGITLDQGEDTFKLPVGTIGLRALTVTSPIVRDVPVGSYNRMVIDTQLDGSYTGPPERAGISGGDSAGQMTITVFPTADQAYTLTAVYSLLEPLTDINTANIILLRAPSIYLYGALLEAEHWAVNDERAPIWGARYAAAVGDFMSQRMHGDMLMTTEVAAMTGRSGFNITTG